MEKLHRYLSHRLPAHLNLLHRMVSINSFTSNPTGVNTLAELTAQTFSRLGFQPEFVQSTNPAFGCHLFLHRKPASPPVGAGTALALVSHLDTVFPPEEEKLNDFHWRPEGDRIYGPGTDDIKGGTVLLFMVLEALEEFHPEIFESIHWLVALNASEEVLSSDFTSQLVQRLPDTTRACLVFEGGTPGADAISLVVSRKGRATYQVEVAGRSAHAGNNHAQGANAILQIAHTIQQVEALTDYANQITFNVGTVHGGSVVNRVPHTAHASVEMRAFSPDIFQDGIQGMLALDGSTHVSSQDGFPCQVRVHITEKTAPWPANPGTQRLYAIWSDAAASLGWTTTTEKRGGLSDGNYLWQLFPTLDGLGPCGANAHCSESSPDGSKQQEYVEVSSFVPRALLNIEAIKRLYALSA